MSILSPFQFKLKSKVLLINIFIFLLAMSLLFLGQRVQRNRGPKVKSKRLSSVHWELRDRKNCKDI